MLRVSRHPALLSGLLAALLVSAAPLPSPAEPSAAAAASKATTKLFHATSHHSFANVEHWKEIFDDPSRDAWQQPAKVIEALGLGPGMRVADIGAGTGYFSGRLARAVGKEGAVLAVDTEPQLVAYLRERAEKEAAANLVPVLASLDNPRLPASSVDVVLLVDTFHHIDGRLAYFRRLAKVFRPGGRLVVIDWYKRKLPVGPPPEHKIPRTQVVEEMEKAGYKLIEGPDFLPYQYFLIFRPTD